MIELTHQELQELLGAFALDAVDGDEYEAVEVHLRGCPRCRAEVADHREIAALIGHGGAPAPEGVWDRIVAAIEPAPPPMRLELRSTSDQPGGSDAAGRVVVPLDSARRPVRNNRIVLALAVAAALLVAVVGVAALRADRTTTTLDAIARSALDDPASRRTELTSPDGKVSVPAAVTKDGAGFLLAGETPPLTDDHTYQLWGVVGDEVISLGTFPGGTEVVPFRVDAHVKALAVTEEVQGGVVSSKNEAVLVGKI